jgi:hypothetical protein
LEIASCPSRPPPSEKMLSEPSGTSDRLSLFFWVLRPGRCQDTSHTSTWISYPIHTTAGQKILVRGAFGLWFATVWRHT